MTTRVFVIGIRRDKMTRLQMERSLQELISLVHTSGGTIVGQSYQEIKKLDSATFIGSGKTKEIAELVLQTKANTVVIDDDLSAMQNRNLEKSLGALVLDRTAIILDIFAMRAHTREGKLQVELAQLEYLAPRLVGRGIALSQQAGRIGTRGPGETQLEYDRRRIKDRITHLKRSIEKVRASRKIYRIKREAVPVPLVAVVGYTNAGKSTLINKLTNAGLFVEDKLFATLDPTVRRFRMPTGREVLVADTVGFISRLPHQLVAAFKATFEEISHADLLIEVVDISDPDARQQMQVVNNVLTEMSLDHKPRILAFNKCDQFRKTHHNLDFSPSPLMGEGQPARHASLQGEADGDGGESGVTISALRGEGLDDLVEKMSLSLRKGFSRVKLYLPYKKGNLLPTIYQLGHVYKAKHCSKHIIIDCDLPEKYEMKFREFQQKH